MRFAISGRSYEISRENIPNATNGVPPEPFDGRHKYYVELHEKKYPIKQVIRLVLGLYDTPYFTAQYAYRILNRLGFAVHTLHIADGKTQMRDAAAHISTAERTMKFAITLEEDENGFTVVSAPALPGCNSRGRTEQEAIANITEAIRGYIASMRRHKEPIPAIKEVREIEVPV